GGLAVNNVVIVRLGHQFGSAAFPRVDMAVMNMQCFDIVSEMPIQAPNEGMKKLPFIRRLTTRTNLCSHHLAFRTLELHPALIFSVRPFCSIHFFGARTVERTEISLIQLDFLLNDLPEEANAVSGNNLK